MTTHDDEPLDADTRAALAGLRGPRQPPPDLEARVLDAIGARGPVVLPQQRRWRGAVALGSAAAAATFLLGIWLGLSRPWAASPPAPAGSPQFMLLLYEDATYEPAPDLTARRQEYIDWARTLDQNGLFVAGEELDPVGVVLTKTTAITELPVESAIGHLAGFFIVLAKDDDDAARIARSCPHLTHGGRIVVKKIVVDAAAAS